MKQCRNYFKIWVKQVNIFCTKQKQRALQYQVLCFFKLLLTQSNACIAFWSISTIRYSTSANTELTTVCCSTLNLYQLFQQVELKLATWKYQSIPQPSCRSFTSLLEENKTVWVLFAWVDKLDSSLTELNVFSTTNLGIWVFHSQCTVTFGTGIAICKITYRLFCEIPHSEHILGDSIHQMSGNLIRTRHRQKICFQLDLPLHLKQIEIKHFYIFLIRTQFWNFVNEHKRHSVEHCPVAFQSNCTLLNNLSIWFSKNVSFQYSNKFWVETLFEDRYMLKLYRGLETKQLWESDF